jgi:hypothetical protein
MSGENDEDRRNDERHGDFISLDVGAEGDGIKARLNDDRYSVMEHEKQYDDGAWSGSHSSVGTKVGCPRTVDVKEG